MNDDMTSTPASFQVPSDDGHSATVKEVLEAMGAEVFYEKALTSSDANGSGRIVIPKATAEMYFPSLENQAGISIDAIDSMGNAYFFKFRFWINNQSRMYLLEGVAELQKRYNLKSNDVMIFAHKRDRTLVVAGRPRTETDVLRKAAVRKMSNGSGQSKKEQRRSGSSVMKSGIKKPRRSTRDSHGSLHRQDFNPFLTPCGQMKVGRQRATFVCADGVFRFLLNAHGLDRSTVFPQSGIWTAVLDIKGEMYQAFFESENDAITAFKAAGYF